MMIIRMGPTVLEDHLIVKDHLIVNLDDSYMVSNTGTFESIRRWAQDDSTDRSDPDDSNMPNPDDSYML